MSLKIKLVCGFRKDQEYTIDVNEAHKAYWLWYNKEQSAIFSNGLAVEGTDIKRIVPDYNATMGWNPTHVLSDDDMNEISESGITRKLRNAMAFAKLVAEQGEHKDLKTPLIELKGKYNLPSGSQSYSSGAQIAKLLPKLENKFSTDER